MGRGVEAGDEEGWDVVMNVVGCEGLSWGCEVEGGRVSIERKGRE